MKRPLAILLALPSLAFGFGATNLYQIPGSGTNMGWTRDGIQSNFQAVVVHPGTNMTAVYTPTGVVLSSSASAGGGAGTTTWLSNGTPVHAAASTVDVTGVSFTITSNSNGKITVNLAAQSGSGITNEMVYDILPTWGTPYHPVAASNSIDASSKVANDTLSTRTATTRTAVIMFSLTSISNTLQGVGRPFMFLSPGAGMTNYAVTWSADQTPTGSLVLLFYNPSGIGPVAAGITGTVSAASTPTVLNIPLASTFLTNIARDVKILGDAFFYSASTNAANQRLQGILDWKAQR